MIHTEMQVIKRNGSKEDVSFDKVMNRLKKLAIDSKFSQKLKVNVSMIAQKVCSRIYNGVSTSELDELAAQICASLITENPDYGSLASRIVISNHHKSTSPSLSETIYILYNNKDIHGNKNPLVSKEIFNIVMENKNKLNDIINYNNDYFYDYFGFKTLERAYLLRVNHKIIERPQQMLMRVSLGIHLNDFKDALNTYKMMSEKYFIHATPTLFNSGTQRPQLSSCFLMGVDDSINSIYKSLSDCASISKWAGGIGIHVHDIRAKSSMIRGTNGFSNGLTPMLRVFNNTARYVDQCIVPSTYLYTTQGPQKICDVIANETVILNDRGETEVIENVLEHEYKGKILNVETDFSSYSFDITPQHPILSVSTTEDGEPKLIPEKIKRNLLTEEYQEAEKITPGDFIAITIPKYEHDNKFLTKDDCYIYGLLLACNSPEKLYQINLKKNNNRCEEIKSICQQYLDSKLVEYQIKDNDDHIKIHWKSSLQLPFRYSDFFNTNNQKHISKIWINLPLNKIQEIIKACFHINGKYLKNNILIDLPMYLSECFRYLLLRLETPSTVKKLSTDKVNLMFIPNTSNLCRLLELEPDSDMEIPFFIYNNRIYHKVTNIESREFTGLVYDLQMKKNHSYNTNNATIHNGGGKRNGSFAIYLEPWHADIKSWLQLKKNHGNEEERARDLFYGLWIPDLFMERVEQNKQWTLMCPDQCPGLTSCHGEEFNNLYQQYEQEGRGVETIDAQELWSTIINSQIETGTPYMLYKDSCNQKSNQQNLGTIKSSNLCTEIIEYSDSKETAVCNLASIGLPTFLEYDKSKKSHSYTIYSKTDCNYCKIAKMMLLNLEIEYQEIILDETESRTAFFEKLRQEQQDNNINTVPQIYINDKWIGGCQQLMEYLKPTFNFEKLIEVTKTITKNLNKVIDRNYYPTPETLLSNKKHRRIGIGIQRLADVFLMMKIPFDSDEARELNEKIFETIYYGAISESMNISKKREVSMIRYKQLIADICLQFNIQPEIIYGNNKIELDTLIEKYLSKQNSISDDFKKIVIEFKNLHQILKPIPQELNRESFLGTYSTFEGSPVSQGKLQFDLWNYQPNKCGYNWDELKVDILKYGLRNSLLLAPMPTASTSQILGNNECFEPFTSNIYTRRTLAGEFIIVNKYLLKDLHNLGIWDNELKNNILMNDGSVTNLKQIPETIRNIYKTVWDIKQKCLIDMSTDRAKFICQSQSLNLFLANPSLSQISSMHFYSWKSGLKTGMYYLRTKPASSAQKFTIEPENNCEACSA